MAFRFWPFFPVDRSNQPGESMTLIPFAVLKADGIIAK
jgi:hypothetical protein